MVPNYRKVKILQVVLNGGTLSEAGASIEVSQSRARDILYRICREFDLPRDLKYMRSNPDEYLNKIEETKEEPKMMLRALLIDKLVRVLKLKNKDELTPQYLSNLTASQLMSNGITPVAVVEIQEWLSKSELTLKRRAPENDEDIKKVKQAIAILYAFQFDTKILNEQLSHLLESS